MGSCCGNKRANVVYEVNFGPGGPPAQRYDTITQAQAALAAAGKPAGSSFKAVPKS